MDTELKKMLRREASLHNMCEENRHALELVESKESAIELYKKTIDWALEEGYPSLAVLRKGFSDCERFGIFVDKTFNGEILDDNQVYVFHNCKGVIRTGLNVSRALIPMMYFANGCDMTVKSSGETNSQVRVPLYIFGGNIVTGEVSDEIECKIYKFDTK